MSRSIPIDDLKKIAGKENLKIDSEKVFISPENSSVVSEIVKLANQEKFKILPSGSGSILDWSKLNFENVIILKSDRLNRVEKVVPEDLYVIVQAGFSLKDLNRHLKSFNLFYPLAPQGAGGADTSSVGTMGGAVATNLKGKSGQKNIQTREYVLALEVIDPEGQTLNIGARTFKSVTGYDLPRLFVGSWGTLGFISQISLRLVPARKKDDYPDITFDPPRIGEIKGQNNLKAILSSRIKKSLDPNAVFFSFDSLRMNDFLRP
jgi:FAD/FMN-containing dehydrogenase